MFSICTCIHLCVCLCKCVKNFTIDGSVLAVQDPDDNLASSSSEFIAPWYICSVTVCALIIIVLNPLCGKSPLLIPREVSYA